MLFDPAHARYDISAFLARRSEWVCRLDGGPPKRVRDEQISVSFEFGRLILFLWGEEFSECWRVEAYEIRGERLLLRLERRPGRTATLEIASAESAGGEAIEERRRTFANVLGRLIERELGARIEYVATHRDDAHHLSGAYTRLIFTRRGERAIAIAVNLGEPPTRIEGLVTAGLIWWEQAASSASGAEARRLVFFAPKGRATTVARRLTVLRSDGPRLDLYEVDEQQGTLTAVTPFDQGALFDPRQMRLPRPITELPPHPLRDRAMALVPGLLRVARRPGSAVESLRLRGLEIARLSRDRLFFGLGANKRPLRDNWEEFERFVHEIARIRHPESQEKTHPAYRLQAERWLEEVIREDVRRVDPRLDPRFLYPQIPVSETERYGLVDLLGITDDGQLALLELKTEEDVEAPMQAAEYWLRVEWHRRRGEITRRGYFPGLKIADRPTLVLIVAPFLRFHPMFDRVVRWIDPRVPVYKIGIAEEWRKGVRVVYRERANA
ncbi:MAG: hypothetical protein N0A16_10535 [Blastocatellia bacterium]|nr:hypothetical protein [Blastocatellia bacterium]MCS7158151.1 hypothetical protein [Blastocatellia bacterium]MCX7752986.1 hypothetical protein [Blastocatellia bacterium]MDW8168509.1 hypothetical protein [Acidobacteriota bacterium]MDW8256923.1 hypothetical protein [Acidobacteriota bacterium]